MSQVLENSHPICHPICRPICHPIFFWSVGFHVLQADHDHIALLEESAFVFMYVGIVLLLPLGNAGEGFKLGKDMLKLIGNSVGMEVLLFGLYR